MDRRQTEIPRVYEIHHLLTQGKSDEAQLVLVQMTGKTVAFPSNECTYLSAWYEVLQGHWEMVTQHARELPVLLESEEREMLLTSGSIRRRRPFCLLLLGQMARELGYPEEAREHLQHCITLLNERRMNIPEVRLLAHCSLGRLMLEMNQADQARIAYETANSLCGTEVSQHPLSAEILTGLCEASTRLEQFEQALAIGKQALHLLQGDTQTSLQKRLFLMLSRISIALGESASAFAYAQDARLLAHQTNDVVGVADALRMRAEIEVKTGQLPEARTSCQQALALLPGDENQRLRAATLLLLGQIAEEVWRGQPEQETFAEEAQARYEQVWGLFETQRDRAFLANVSLHLAKLLEARGQSEQALSHWKNAYTLFTP